MKKRLCMFIVLVTVTLQSCATGIAFREDVKSKTIQAELFISYIPEPEMNWAGLLQEGVFKVIKRGNLGYDVKIHLTYVASIYDVKSNSLIWQYREKIKTPFPGIMSTNGDAEDPEKVKETLKKAIDKVIRNCFAQINT